MKIKPSSDSATIRVALVEDDAGIRSSWQQLIASESGLKCVAASASAEEALVTLADYHPHIILLDINLPGMSGIECASKLKQMLPTSRVLMVTVYADSDRLFAALKAGADGYIIKSAEPNELLRAIRSLHDGGGAMSGMIARKVIEAFRPIPSHISSEEMLTPREVEVLDLISKGLTNKEIAQKLNTSPHTIRVHVRHILEKLHVHTRVAAAAKHRQTQQIAT